MPTYDNTGNKRMSEEDMLIPALKIIRTKSKCTMSYLKKQIQKEMVFYPGDLEPSPTRPGECKYHQIIGNLISHRSNNLFGKYVDVIKNPNTNENEFTLNQDGINFLNNLEIEEINHIVDESFENDLVQISNSYPDNYDLTDKNNRKPEIKNGSKNNRYSTNSTLAKTVLKRCNFKCEYAKLTGIEHDTFPAKNNYPYLEAHHLIPMKAQKDFGNKNLDREENIIGLCPLCHSIVHYGNLTEKKRVLKVLYDERINKLQNCDHSINITFEDLINKYYI